MKTPAFWQSKSPLSNALMPLALLYGIGSLLKRQCVTPKTIGVPIICIGGVTAGGAGKTPVAL